MLSATAIRSLKPLEKPKKYSDGGGLYLYVPKTGSKLFALLRFAVSRFVKRLLWKPENWNRHSRQK